MAREVLELFFSVMLRLKLGFDTELKQQRRQPRGRFLIKKKKFIFYLRILQLSRLLVSAELAQLKMQRQRSIPNENTAN